MKKLFAMTVAVLLLFSVLLGIPAAYGQAPETGKTLDILFSHDTHSHLNTFTTVVEDEEAEIGGFARANTLIKAQRAKDPDTLVIDGGDFSMGTLIQTVFESQAAELQLLGYMGCDATTFGNHEYDFRSKGLANMLTSATDSGDPLPALVVCNVDWDAMEAAGLTEGQQRAMLEKEKERRIKLNNRIEILERRIQEAEAAEVNEMVRSAKVSPEQLAALLRQSATTTPNPAALAAVGATFDKEDDSDED